MSNRNTVFVAIFLVSYVTGITGTVDDYAEQAANSLADVAHMRQFYAAIRSRSPEWYRDGVQLFAWETNEHKWDGDKIRWGIKKYSKKIPKNVVEEVFRKAFEKWRLEIPKDFEEVTNGFPRDGIRISFRKNWQGPTIRGDEPTTMEFPSHYPKLNLLGVDIIINENKNWTDESAADYHNLRFAALYAIGHALGLGDSDKPQAVMFETCERITQKGEPLLQRDDVEGIQSIYGTREGGGLAYRDIDARIG